MRRTKSAGTTSNRRPVVMASSWMMTSSIWLLVLSTSHSFVDWLPTVDGLLLPATSSASRCPHCLSPRQRLGRHARSSSSLHSAAGIADGLIPNGGDGSGDGSGGAPPRVIVFDLDNTLWTPELYQLKRRLRLPQPSQLPVAGRDVRLFPGAKEVLESILPTMRRRRPRGGTLDESNDDDDDDDHEDSNSNSNSHDDGPFLAIASRTQEVEWAHRLVDQFGFRNTFDAIEIYPGPKTRHFANIRRITGVPYHEMIFFDDARDGKYGNCEPVAALGVLAVHCPDGLVSADIFTRAVRLYQTEWTDRTPNTIVEWDGRMTTTPMPMTGKAGTSKLLFPPSTTSTRTDGTGNNNNDDMNNNNSNNYNHQNNKGINSARKKISSAPILEGIVRLVRPNKGYGFIRYRGPVQSRDVFFHFNNLLPYDSKDGSDANSNDDSVKIDTNNASVAIQEGDSVSFQIQPDPRSSDKHKDMAVNVKVLSPTMDDIASSSSSSSSSQSYPSSSEELVQFRCFSMNQPFAALLANGYKTVETRNGTMFVPYAEGTQMLLHVGQRTYPDGGRHVQIMKEHHHRRPYHHTDDGDSTNQRDELDMTDEEIDRLKSLPQGYSRGDIVAIVELGRTYETSTTERSDPDFERKAVAYGMDSGRIVTEIKRVAYLTRPIKQKGEGGVFTVRIDPRAIPDEFHVPMKGGENSRFDAAYAIISG